MKRKTMIYLSVTAIFVLAGIFAWNTMARAAYESAEYKVVTSDGKFEVREYPDLMLVATTTKLDAQGRDGSFMKLFRYISGANESDKKISMTTPVFMENDKEDSAVQMGFVMPKNIAVEGVPAPTGEGVDVRKRAGGRFAVMRFSGQLNAKSAKESESKLRTWMAIKGLVADDSAEGSGVETAGYDPPFTPSPLRRNEVLIRLK
jgi:DNA gyrase inhibitor GyrI